MDVVQATPGSPERVTMAPQIEKVVCHLRRAVCRQAGASLMDRQLLAAFIDHRSEEAIAALVRRHGPMVWGVCRRVIGNHHEAEDAFQATFLVLVRKAATIRPRAMVGNWLYGVARQTARKARTLLAKRHTRERQMTYVPDRVATPLDREDDVLALLDEELARLPDKYRVAIVLCDLEGQTRRDAAKQLGLPEGTLAGRLTRGRALLARRLARNGAALSGGSVAALLAENAARAVVPAAVLSTTIKAANLVASAPGAGAISAPVAALTEGVLRTMLLTKVRTVLGIGLVLGALLAGGVFGFHALAADKAAAPPAKERLEDTLILLDKQWWQAASNYDVDTLSKLLADDWAGFDRGVWPAADSARWTKAASLENFRRFHFTEVQFLKEREVFRIDEHSALMIYEVKWRAEGKDLNPGSGQSRYVRCWVQRDGGWFVKFTECLNLPPMPARQPRVRASSSWKPSTSPDKAFDGNSEAYWNSGDYAPAWIEADLGASTPLFSIVLIPVQDILGATTHEVWVSNEPIGDDRSKAKLAHTFKGETKNAEELKFAFPKDTTARYIQVRTTQSPTWIAWQKVEIRVVHDGKPQLVLPAAPSAK
jgi:RNA polymerase sigma factor (sigma-70 family)